MDASTIVIILALFTLGAVAVFAFRSKKSVEERMEKQDAPKSTLAADKDSHGKPADV